MTVVTDDTDENASSEGPRKRPRRTGEAGASARHWYPWNDRIVSLSFLSTSKLSCLAQTCTLDVLMHLPRSVFSHRQLDLFLWLLKVNQVDDVPSVKSMTAMNDLLQKLCGIDTIPYDGALGHKYYVNSLSQIIAQVRSKYLHITSLT